MREEDENMKKEKQKKEDKRLVINYNIPETENEKLFKQGIKLGKLKAGRCRKCKKVFLPPPDYCSICSEKIRQSDIFELPNSGKVISQTVVHYPVYEFSSLTPPFALIAVKVPKTDSVFIIPSKRLDIYLGDRIKIFFKRGKDKKGDISDIEIEKL